jgi:hypothetical protein
MSGTVASLVASWGSMTCSAGSRQGLRVYLLCNAVRLSRALHHAQECMACKSTPWREHLISCLTFI